MTIVVEPTAGRPLPYGPRMSRLLRPLQRGFLVLNRGFMAPLLRNRLGWLVGNPVTGHLLLLRTRGRRSGLLREAPLGYVIRGGSVYCVAGYGEPTPWYRNLLADPAVEVILPTRRFRGRAAPVTGDAEWVAAYRALIDSFGPLGRSVVGDVGRLDDATLLADHRSLPVVRITPVDDEPPLVAGPFDPGGGGWKLAWVASVVLGALAWATFAGPKRWRARRRPNELSVPDTSLTRTVMAGRARLTAPGCARRPRCHWTRDLDE